MVRRKRKYSVHLLVAGVRYENAIVYCACNAGCTWAKGQGRSPRTHTSLRRCVTCGNCERSRAYKEMKPTRDVKKYHV